MDKDLDGARIAMTDTTNRRHYNRIPIRLEAFYSAGRVAGVGEIANISYSGALIKDTVMRPEIGTPIKLNLYLKPPSAFTAATPFELVGHIVRHSTNGFAIEYEDSHDPHMRRMVDDAAAVVAVPH